MFDYSPRWLPPLYVLLSPLLTTNFVCLIIPHADYPLNMFDYSPCWLPPLYVLLSPLLTTNFVCLIIPHADYPLYMFDYSPCWLQTLYVWLFPSLTIISISLIIPLVDSKLHLFDYSPCSLHLYLFTDTAGTTFHSGLWITCFTLPTGPKNCTSISDRGEFNQTRDIHPMLVQCWASVEQWMSRVCWLQMFVLCSARRCFVLDILNFCLTSVKGYMKKSSCENE